MNDFSIPIPDLVTVIVIGVIAFRSLFKGAARALFSFIGILAAYLASSLYYSQAARLIDPLFGSPPWINIAAFITVFVGVLWSFAILEYTILKLFIAPTRQQDLSSLIAFFLGLLEGFLFCSIIIWILQNQRQPRIDLILENSLITPYLLNYNPLLIGVESQLNAGPF